MAKAKTIATPIPAVPAAKKPTAAKKPVAVAAGAAARAGEDKSRTPKKGDLVEVTIARGHTVVRNGITHLPRAKIMVEPEERDRLIRIGTAVDPKGRVAPALGMGPKFGNPEIDDSEAAAG